MVRAEYDTRFVRDSGCLVSGGRIRVDRRCMLAARVRTVGAPTLVETRIVLGAQLGTEAQGLLDRFLQVFGVFTVPLGEAHWREASEAFLRFGRGRHQVRLNFGDCLSYATAR